MRVRTVEVSVIATLALVVSGCGGGDDDEQSDTVTVEDAWALPTVAGATTGAVYLHLRSPIDDMLVSASAEPAVAARVSFHDSEAMSTGASESTGDDMAEHDRASMDQEMMSMVPVASYPLSAGEELEFAPGVRHIMLEDLTTPLEDGETFDLTLEFEHAAAVVVPVTVTVELDG